MGRRPMVVAAGDDAWRSLCTRADPLDLSRSGAWLILAPHPDDETLGLGGLLAKLVDQAIPVWIAYLTSGEASHVGAAQWPAGRIARARRAEAQLALGKLGHSASRTRFLNWRDGKPPMVGSLRFRRSCAALLALCRRHDIRNIATTWRGEAHCDHRAAYELGNAVVSRSEGRMRHLQYLVWGWTDPALKEKAASFEVESLDTRACAERCRAAIACHRTQLTSLIRGARDAFRLTPDMVAIASRSPLILLREGERHAA